VEKIALTIWRQRRLLRAETAQINQQISRDSLLSAAGYRLNGLYGPKLTVEDLEAAPAEEIQRGKQGLRSHRWKMGLFCRYPSSPSSGSVEHWMPNRRWAEGKVTGTSLIKKPTRDRVRHYGWRVATTSWARSN